MLPLFADKTRTSPTYSKAGERTYAFLDRSAMPQFEEVRNRLKQWFANYPKEEQKELKSRFEDGTHFDDAFFELYIHELFFSKGYQLTIHPQLPHTDKRPDFLVTKGSARFYLEAKVVMDETKEEKLYRKRQEKLVDELNRIEAFPYWICVRSLDIHSKESFSIKPLIKAIQNHAANSNYFNLLQHKAYSGLEYSNEHFAIEIDLYAKSQSIIGGVNPAVGVRGFYDAKLVTNAISLEKAVIAKASKYGRLDAPLVIALNSLSPYSLSASNIQDLVGHDWSRVHSNIELEKDNSCPPSHGIFRGKYQNKHQHLAGLLITSVSPFHNGAEERFWCANENCKTETFNHEPTLLNAR